MSIFKSLTKITVAAICGLTIIINAASAVNAQDSAQDILKKIAGQKAGTVDAGASTTDKSRDNAQAIEQKTAPVIGRAAPVLKQFSAIELAYQNRAGQAALRQQLVDAVSEGRQAYVRGGSAGNEDMIDQLDQQLLQHYGHDMFANLSTVSGSYLGEMSPDYVIGVGDEFSVSLVGANPQSYVVKVDREGKLLVPGLNPMNVAGKTFGTVRTSLSEQIESALVGTELYLSMGGLRRFTVQLFGEVNRPGTVVVDSSADLLTVIARAGGIRKSGSLRNIKVITNGKSRIVDFYDLIFGGEVDLSIIDGARIVVPPIGNTVAIQGRVLHPGIFEISESDTIGLDDFISISGGLLRKNGNLYRRNYIDEEGRTKLGIIRSDKAIVQINDLVTVYYDSWKPERGVRAAGNVRSPQSFILEDRPTVSSLIKDGEMLGDEFYPYFAVLRTKDEPNGRFYFKPINLKTILAKAEDVNLRDEDSFIVFSRAHMDFLSSPQVKAALYGGGGGCRSLVELRKNQPSGRFDHVRSLVGAESVIATPEMACPAIFEETDGLLPFVLEHALAVQGSIRASGLFPVTGDVSLKELVAYSGGLSRNVDLRHVEESSVAGGTDLRIVRVSHDFTQTNMSTVHVQSGSRYTFYSSDEKLEIGTVSISGEVNRPGTYAIRRGEKLTDVIERAGGLTREAYPFGSIFTRVSLRERESRNLRRAANEMKDALLFASLKHRDMVMGADVVALAMSTLDADDTLGRMVIETDPDVLAARPEEDTYLEPGDLLYIPSTPSYVIMSGDVLNATSLHYDPNKTVKDYIREAGGITQTADEDSIYIVQPNGEAQRVTKSFWKKKELVITPGTTIFVPKNMTPFNSMMLIKDITSILSQMALSAASIAVISR